MPGSKVHLTSAIIASIIGNKNINIATIMVGTIIPDLMSVIAIPCSIFIKGPDLNSIYNFFDQTLIWGVVDVVTMSIVIIHLINKYPKFVRVFTYRQKHDKNTIIIPSIIGGFLHIILDKYYM